MGEQSYERAVQILKDRVGMRWEGAAEDQGELARMLAAELHIARADADQLIAAMIADGQLRFHRGAADEVGGVIPGAPAIGMAGAPISSGSGGTIGVPVIPAALSPGYWQIGTDESERAAEPLVREGQVDPTQ